MQRFLSILFLSLVVLSNPASAKEVDSDVLLAVDEQMDKSLANEDIQLLSPVDAGEMRPVGLTDVVDSPSFITDGAAVAKPECDNVRLKRLVLNKIAEYYKNKPVNSMIEKRRQILMLKNLKSFQDVNILTFPKKENYTVSDKLIAYKINKGLEDDDFRLCRSNSAPAIYLLIYPQNNVYVSEIVNFPGQAISERFSVIYD